MSNVLLGIGLISIILFVFYLVLNKNASVGMKLLGFVAASIPIIILTFFVAVFIALMGFVQFYVPFVVIVGIGVLFFICNAIFRFLSPRVLKISLVSFIVLCAIAVASNEGYKFYVDSQTMDNEEVDLTEYEPFTNSSKLAKLEDEASFQMDGDLLRLDGATALYPLYAAFAQATYPEGSYPPYDPSSMVMSTKTPNAYNNLFNGEVDMIFVAGPSERQLERAENMGLELEMTPIGREAFVFFVNGKNPVNRLTLEEIKGIYSGEISNWKKVGGDDEKIRAFQRPNDSGSQTALENLMGDTPLMDPPTDDVVTGMGGIIEQTSNYRNYRNAIGYSFRFFSMDMVKNDSIQLLEVDGVFPDKDSIRTGKYPIASEFYAITAGSENPHIEGFLQWILSKEGQSLVEETGYVPVQE